MNARPTVPNGAAGAQRVSACLFDLGNVVVDWQPLHLYRQIFADPAEAESFCSHVCTLSWHTRHDMGVAMDDNIAARIREFPHYAEPIRAWKTRWLDMFTGYVPGVPEIIARLESARVPLYGLSNLPAEKVRETFDAFPMIRVLRDVVVSGEVGLIKPDPRIYELALERMGRAAGEVLFIDDREDNVLAAGRLGFATHHFRGAPGLAQALAAHGLL